MYKLKKLLAVFMIWLVITMPIVFASNIQIEDVYVSGEEGTPDFSQRSDRVKVTTEILSPNDAISPEQVRFCSESQNSATSGFDSCESDGDSRYTCTYTTDDHLIINEGEQIFPDDSLNNICVYDSETSTYTFTSKEDNKDLSEFTLSPDTARPRLINPSVSTKRKDGKVGLEAEFSATDANSGIKKYIFAVDSYTSSDVVEFEYEYDISTGYDEEVGVVQEFLEVDAGTHDVYLKIIDGAGNSYEKVYYNVVVDGTAPTIKSWHILESDACTNNGLVNDFIDHEVGGVGNIEREVCIATFFDFGTNSIYNHGGINLTLIDFDSKYRPGEFLFSNPTDCHYDIHGQYCMFEHYDVDEDGWPDTDDSIKLAFDSEHGTAASVSAIIQVADDAGNVNQKSDYKSILYVSEPPVVASFKSLNNDGGNNYVGINASFVAQLTNNVEAINPDNMKIDVCDLISHSECGAWTASNCTIDGCLWEVNGVDKNDGKNALIKIVNSHDNFGNRIDHVDVDSITLQAVALVDLVSPSLGSIKIENTGVEGQLFSEDGSLCVYGEDGDVSSECIYPNFWKYNNTYVALGSDLDIKVAIDDEVGAKEAYLEIGDIISNLDSKVMPDGDCAMSNDEFVCEWLSLGPVTELTSSINLTVIDQANNMEKYKIPLPIYNARTSTGTSLYWSIGDEDITVSPKKVDRQLLANLTGYSRQLVIYDFQYNMGGNTGDQIVHVDIKECDAIDPDLTDDSDPRGLINSSFAYWDGTSAFIELQYGSDPETDTLNLSCDLEITTLTKNGYVIGPELYEDLTFTTEFINTPFGTPSEAIKDEIEDVKDSWDWYNSWLSSVEKVLAMVRPLCKLMGTLGNLVIALEGVSDIITATLGTNPTTKSACVAADSAIKASKKPLDGALGGLLKTIKPYCDYITCQHCGDFSADKIHESRKDMINSKDSSGNTDLSSVAVCLKKAAELRKEAEGKDPKKTNLCATVFSVPICYSMGLNWLRNPLGEFLSRSGGLKYSGSETGMAKAFKDSLDNTFAKPPATFTGDDSFIASLITLCVPGVMKNIEKFRQIDCKYITCLEEDVVSGASTIDNCKYAREYAKCAYGVEEWWILFPLNELFDQIAELIEEMLTDPLTIVSYGASLYCSDTCGKKGCATGLPSCTACILFAFFGSFLEQITDIIEKLSSDDDGASLFKDGEDYCKGVMDD